MWTVQLVDLPCVNYMYVLEDFNLAVCFQNRQFAKFHSLAVSIQYMAPDIHHGRSLIQHGLRILQAHTYIAIWCVTTPDNKTHVPYDCVVHTKR